MMIRHPGFLLRISFPTSIPSIWDIRRSRNTMSKFSISRSSAAPEVKIRTRESSDASSSVCGSFPASRNTSSRSQCPFQPPLMLRQRLLSPAPEFSSRFSPTASPPAARHHKSQPSSFVLPQTNFIFILYYTASAGAGQSPPRTRHIPVTLLSPHFFAHLFFTSFFPELHAVLIFSGRFSGQSVIR